jgi:hypothetical protein
MHYFTHIPFPYHHDIVIDLLACFPKRDSSRTQEGQP